MANAKPSPRKAVAKKAIKTNLNKIVGRRKPPTDVDDEQELPEIDVEMESDLSSDDGPQVTFKAAKKATKKGRKTKDPFAEDEAESKNYLSLLSAVASPNNPKKNMVDDLKAIIAKYLIPDKKAEKNKEITELVLHKVDHNGLTGNPIIAMMRNLQQDIRLRPGFYKALVKLDTAFNNSRAQEGVYE